VELIRKSLDALPALGCGWRGSLAITLAAPCECLIATAHANGYLLAGSGVKGGTVYDATDDFGFKAIDKPVHVSSTLRCCI
jgi:hypothetical protein